jgi:hypothetical protein
MLNNRKENRFKINLPFKMAEIIEKKNFGKNLFLQTLVHSAVTT